MQIKQLTTTKTKLDKDYKNLLQELKSIFSENLYKAYKTVDNIKVQAYWQIGERIVREELKHENRADYGKYLIENLALDLGIGKRDLYRIVKFYRCYEIVTAVASQLSWSHYIELINIGENKKRLFYQNKSILHSWSAKELRKQIVKIRLFENRNNVNFRKIINEI